MNYYNKFEMHNIVVLWDKVRWPIGTVRIEMAETSPG